MSVAKLPEFFVLGTQKAGTTTLHDRLSKHPDICLPRLKETQFFAFEEKHSRGLEWYQEQFPQCRDDQVVGEVCPDYMYFPGSAERIASVVEKPKLIFIFREPLERAYSQYLMSVRQGFESLSFADALIEEKLRLEGNAKAHIYHSYLSRGRYAGQIERFMKELPQASHLYIRFEDLTDRGPIGQATFDRICDFIGVPWMAANLDRHSNKASKPRSDFLRKTLYGQSPLKHALGRWLPFSVKERIAVTLDAWNQVPIEKGEMPAVDPSFVAEALLETEKLERMTGLDLSGWKRLEDRS
jgi:hypothetical protein